MRLGTRTHSSVLHPPAAPKPGFGQVLRGNAVPERNFSVGRSAALEAGSYHAV